VRLREVETEDSDDDLILYTMADGIRSLLFGAVLKIVLVLK
jgi:hypothetical protein